MTVSAIIPARYASTRFPGKPLADIAGKPMIQHVYEQTAKSALVNRVIVATDDERICDSVLGFGGEAVMTRADHPSGTDRLAEVAAGLDAEWIVNVQGDEPLIDPQMIDEAVQPMLDNPEIRMGTLKSRLVDESEYLNPNIVKVVTDQSGFALYFSRSSIPFLRDSKFGSTRIYKHVGLYVYRRDFLLQYPQLEETELEKSEKLEQLRALEHGYRIYVTETARESIGVDVPGDIGKVLARLAN
ncbi:MAG: 3-deoxy-manno-octulosonate cytidylyltransferase [Desulfuromonas sp.]|nr:MAG: 3-deoxy-manno-octulosonate cytidylyltransferase [Desulfuromonas sp.]